MAALTALIIAGVRPMYDDGIVPRAEMSLFENDRPAWVLKPQSVILGDRDRLPPPNKRIWIPASPGSILEDGLLMLALCLWRSRDLCRAARGFIDIRAQRQDLTELDGTRLSELRDQARAEEKHGKITLCAFYGSSILPQLDQVKPWAIPAEVCTPHSIHGYDPRYCAGFPEDSSEVSG